MKRKVKISVLLLFLGLASLQAEEEFYRESGLASWYGPGFQGKLTANGERFDTNKLTAAHKSLPFGSLVRVINRENGKEVVVRINDRGPFVPGRIIDLSRAAAARIEMLENGTVPVHLELLEPVAGIAETEAQSLSIQVASFSQPENAENLRSRLRESNLEASIVRSGAYHRVMIEDVGRDELEEVLEVLTRIGYPQPLIR